LFSIVVGCIMFAASGLVGQEEDHDPCGTSFPVSNYVQVVVGSENFTPPEKISGANPDFSHVKGPVKLSAIVMEVFISAEGVVDGVLILRGEESELTRPAAQEVFGWTFEPATLDGQPVPCRYILTVRF
jgi:hypothetical protein